MTAASDRSFSSHDMACRLRLVQSSPAHKGCRPNSLRRIPYNSPHRIRRNIPRRIRRTRASKSSHSDHSAALGDSHTEPHPRGLPAE